MKKGKKILTGPQQKKAEKTNDIDLLGDQGETNNADHNDIKKSNEFDLLDDSPNISSAKPGSTNKDMDLLGFGEEKPQ